MACGRKLERCVILKAETFRGLQEEITECSSFVSLDEPYFIMRLTRIIKFASRFPDAQIVVPLAQQLSWSHFIALLPLKSDEAFMYYAQDATARHLGKSELRNYITICFSSLVVGGAASFFICKKIYVF